MAPSSVTVLGGGNTGFAAAANLTLRGFEVTLCELPEFSDAIEAIRERKTIHLLGVAERGAARVHSVTTDFAEALRGSDLALLIVPAYGQRTRGAWHRGYGDRGPEALPDDRTAVSITLPDHLALKSYARSPT